MKPRLSTTCRTLASGTPAWIGLAIHLLSTGACARSSHGPQAAVVADTSLGTVICGDLQDYRAHATARAVRRGDAEGEADWRLRLVHQVAAQRVLAQEARELGALADPRFESKWQEKRRVLLRQALEGELDTAATVDDQEVASYFAAHEEEFAAPETITTSFILRKVGPGAPETEWRTEEAGLHEVRRRSLAGEPFARLAREFSQAENAGRGGAVKTSRRGTLLADYERVAWSLEAGAVSPVVRLPDGPALILLERRNPARTIGSEEARRVIAKRLRAAKRRALSTAAAAESCGSWPPELDALALAAAIDRGESTLRLGDSTVDVLTLGISPHGPWWEDRLLAGLEAFCLDRTAELRPLAERPELAAQLAAHHEGLLAAWATDRRLQACAAQVPEAELQTLFARHAAAFGVRERRVFDVARIASAASEQRSAAAEARAAADAWASGAPLPLGALLERWGPLDQAQLASMTSPLLARRAFALAPAEIGDPLPLERYSTGRASFEVGGYVVLRLAEVQPAQAPSFEAVRSEVLRFASRPERSACLKAEVERAVASAALNVATEALASCPLPALEPVVPERSGEPVSPSESTPSPVGEPGDAAGSSRGETGSEGRR